MTRTCSTCSASEILAIRPGENAAMLALAAVELMLRPGSADKTWCRACWIKARKPPKKRGSPVAAGTPRYAVGKAMVARLRKRGILL